MTKTITDRFGHKIQVKEWPSTPGMAKLRKHYKRNHPRAWKAAIRKGVATRKARRKNPVATVAGIRIM